MVSCEMVVFPWRLAVLRACGPTLDRVTDHPPPQTELVCALFCRRPLYRVHVFVGELRCIAWKFIFSAFFILRAKRCLT